MLNRLREIVIERTGPPTASVDWEAPEDPFADVIPDQEYEDLFAVVDGLGEANVEFGTDETVFIDYKPCHITDIANESAVHRELFWTEYSGI